MRSARLAERRTAMRRLGLADRVAADREEHEYPGETESRLAASQTISGSRSCGLRQQKGVRENDGESAASRNRLLCRSTTASAGPCDNARDPLAFTATDAGLMRLAVARRSDMGAIVQGDPVRCGCALLCLGLLAGCDLSRRARKVSRSAAPAPSIHRHTNTVMTENDDGTASCGASGSTPSGACDVRRGLHRHPAIVPDAIRPFGNGGDILYAGRCLGNVRPLSASRPGEQQEETFEK